MIIYSVVSEKQDIDGSIIKIFSVVDDEGMPINDGNFTDESDAIYVRDQMNTDKFHGDNISNLCKNMDSWISC